MLEEWKLFQDGEYKLLVSNYGNVNQWTNKKPMYLRPDSLGYLTVRVRKNNKDKTYKVHRLVAICFIPNSENKPTVNHLDGIKYNNHLTNLEWATMSENIKHAVKTGLIDRSGSKNSSTAMTEDEVHEICQWFQDNPTLGSKRASEIFDKNISCLSQIRCGKNWKNIRKLYNIPPLTNRAKFND